MILALACAAPDPTVRFVGDVILARGVAEQIAARGPRWEVPAGELWVGNLEGTLAVGECTDPICLGFPSLDGVDARRPFVALGLANNHAHDHGEAGFAATVGGLKERGIVPVVPGERAGFVTVGGVTLGLVALDLTGDVLPALDAARIALLGARARTPWVVAMPHWGIEGFSGTTPAQEEVAALLRRWGATMVVGSHAHVPGPVACPVWYNLGNYLFDQPDPRTWTGLTVRCSMTPDRWTCTTQESHRSARSVFPTLGAERGECVVAAEAVDTSWLDHPRPDALLTAERLPAAGEHAWLATHRRPSTFDDADGLRPYVFRLDPSLVEVWRGTSFARPLVAVKVLDGDSGTVCALQRGDSFLSPNPADPDRIAEVYQWTGFGFRSTGERCEGW